MLRKILFIYENNVFYIYYCSTDHGTNMKQWKVTCQDTHNIVSAYKDEQPLRCVNVTEEISITDDPVPVLIARFKI